MGNQASSEPARAPPLDEEEKKLPKVALEALKGHNKRGDLWIAVRGRVFDVSKFAADHPGGDSVLLSVAGKDATADFDDVGHSAEATKRMLTYRVGVVAEAFPA